MMRTIERAPLEPSGVVVRAPRTRTAAGFTLVELLVVIGIIALLISILMPVLNSARKKAQAVQCASNLRQIYMACAMFATENKGHLPRSYLVGELSSNPDFRRVNAWSQKAAGAAGHADLDDDMGAIFRQIPGKGTRENLLMCPGDTGERLFGHATDPNYPRNYSYSFNFLIGPRRDDPPGPPRLGLRLSRVQKSADKIMIYEELAPNDTWCIMGRSVDDFPSGRHGDNTALNAQRNPFSNAYLDNGLGNMAFFDGHVAQHRPRELIDPVNGPRWHCPLVQGDPVSFSD